MYYNKHYISVDTKNRILAGFSDAFNKPKDDDICINEQGGALFRLFSDGLENPPLTDIATRCHLYRYENGQVRKATDAELAAELAEIEDNRPPVQPTADEVNSQAIAELSILQAQQSAQTNMAIAELSVLIGGATNV